MIGENLVADSLGDVKKNSLVKMAKHLVDFYGPRGLFCQRN